MGMIGETLVIAEIRMWVCISLSHCSASQNFMAKLITISLAYTLIGQWGKNGPVCEDAASYKLSVDACLIPSLPEHSFVSFIHWHNSPQVTNTKRKNSHLQLIFKLASVC